MADNARLTNEERNAFEEIAAALRDRIVDGLAAANGAASEAGSPAAEARESEPPAAEPLPKAAAAGRVAPRKAAGRSAERGHERAPGGYATCALPPR